MDKHAPMFENHFNIARLIKSPARRSVLAGPPIQRSLIRQQSENPDMATKISPPHVNIKAASQFYGGFWRHNFIPSLSPHPQGVTNSFYQLRSFCVRRLCTVVGGSVLVRDFCLICSRDRTRRQTRRPHSVVRVGV